MPAAAVGLVRDAPQTFTAGPLPTFLTGLHLAVARWQVNCVLEPSQLASVSGIKQVARLQFRNTFPRHVSGSVALRVPAMWDVRESKFSFRLSDNEPRDEPLDIVLQADACAGPQRVQIDFEVEADRRYQFSIYRDVQVGSGDVVAGLDSWLDDDGQLIVEQYLTNNSAYPLNSQLLPVRPRASPCSPADPGDGARPRDPVLRAAERPGAAGPDRCGCRSKKSVARGS